MKTLRHSPSSLDTWTNCPRLWKAKYIDKVVPYVENPAAARGTEIHTKLENGVKSGTPPKDVWAPPGLIEALHTKGALVEEKMGLTTKGEVVPFNSPDAKLRGVMDVYLQVGNQALIIDWKTGKVRPKKLQADVYTTFAQALIGPHAEVSFRFVYVDQKQTVELNRDADAPTRVFELIAEVEADTEHLPQPGWLCRFCDYYACRYNENPTKYAREKDDE